MYSPTNRPNDYVLSQSASQVQTATSPTYEQVPYTISTAPPRSAASIQELIPGNNYICHFSYQPTLPDELLIAMDDVIQLSAVYDDGWGEGFNLSRITTITTSGVFPLACLVSNDQSYQLSASNPEYFEQGQDMANSTSPGSYLARSSSSKDDKYMTL